jgi:glycosyltransferase involved in cell wall biosynthesis
MAALPERGSGVTARQDLRVTGRWAVSSSRYSPPVTDDPSNPTLSIVIPVRNGAGTLAAQLDALAAAEPPGVPFEVVVADNGSTDGTAAIARAYQTRLPIRVIDAGRERGTNVARNEGVGASRGSWVLLCDADDEVDVGWLRVMCSSLAAGHELVGGVIDYERLNTPEVRAWRGAQRAGVLLHLGFLPFSHTANIGFSRGLFDAIGGFDERFQNANDDVEFCWRAQLAGFVLHDEPSAIVHYRLRPDLGALWRQFRNYGTSEVLLFREFRAKGLSRRPVRLTVRDTWWLVSRLPFAIRYTRRGAWVRRAAVFWGRCSGSLRYRTIWL